MSKFLESHYQRLLKPFKNANVYYPNTLEEYLNLVKREIDPDESMFEFGASIIRTLIRINETTFPHECASIRRKMEDNFFQLCG